MSTDTRAGVAPMTPVTTGSTRSISSAGSTSGTPVMPDCPPMSMTVAPSPASEVARSTRCATVVNSPASENESGVAFTMPMIQVDGNEALAPKMYQHDGGANMVSAAGSGRDRAGIGGVSDGDALHVRPGAFLRMSTDRPAGHSADRGAVVELTGRGCPGVDRPTVEHFELGTDRDQLVLATEGADQLHADRQARTPTSRSAATSPAGR